MTRAFLKAGDSLVPLDAVTEVVIDRIEFDEIEIVTATRSYTAKGFDAIEAVMLLKPSALEGRRLRWRKHAWSIHNLIGHPVMQILAWCGYGRLGIRFHDYTTPTPRG